MKSIPVFGAGKSAVVLIRTLLETCAAHDWHLVVADRQAAAAAASISGSSYGSVLEIDIEDNNARAQAIAPSSLVISLLPPSLHYLVALDCLQLGKNLLTASYVSPEMQSLSHEVRAKGLIFLCEMGLDPGTDHMSAMQVIEDIRREGGRITGFRSHCGGLVSPESDDNPWHYKISWNPANIVAAGMDGAIFLKDGVVVNTGYQEIFKQNWLIDFPSLHTWAVYPNRDSMKYRDLYGLTDTINFVRTTIRHPDFIQGWAAIAAAGLTSNNIVPADFTVAEWSSSLANFTNDGNRSLFEYLGLSEFLPVRDLGTTSAKILQALLERRLAMKPRDKDMILMLHELEFSLDGKLYREESSFRLDGFDSTYTAMATTVGLPLAHAAELILLDQIHAKGVQIPTSPEIYEKVLPKLVEDGIGFNASRKLIG